MGFMELMSFTVLVDFIYLMDFTGLMDSIDAMSYFMENTTAIVVSDVTVHLCKDFGA